MSSQRFPGKPLRGREPVPRWLTIRAVRFLENSYDFIYFWRFLFCFPIAVCRAQHSYENLQSNSAGQRGSGYGYKRDRNSASLL